MKVHPDLPQRLLVSLVLLAIGLTAPFATSAAAAPPDQGPGGPILVISSSDSFGRYYAEILRAEGLNEFNVTDLSNVTPTMLSAYDVVILGRGALSATQATALTNWVQGGGNLIAMRPDPQLAGLLGLSTASGTLANAYLKVDTTTGAGAGIVGQTIQFHGTADRYTPAGAQTIAGLYSNAATATANPAVTLRSVGSNGGQAAAFTYDLARSVVYTRQGNPAWSGQERDGSSPVRSDDLFFGAKSGDLQPDWVDLSKVAIPQADEQQHLLTNLIEQMNVDRKPLPRFWILPRDEKAAVVMTGDDHQVGGTAARFQHYEDLSPPGCSVAGWECVRATSYVQTNIGSLTNAEATALQSAGFEIGLHLDPNCSDWSDQAQLESFYTSQLGVLATNYPGLDPPATIRTHCVVWSDWATQPKVELENGIRLDTNYYYWPSSWIANRPGLFTGSGMPMRFADLDGSMIDVYQAVTQMTDESGQSYPFTINTLLDRALGPEGYYGVFTANMHNDLPSSGGADAIISSALARGVPVVSARQMLDWLDGRNASSFGSLSWAANTLSFTISVGQAANGLRGMVPTSSSDGALTQITRNGTPIGTTTMTVKGREYAFFNAVGGSYQASYDTGETTPPDTTIDSGPSGPTSDATPTFTFHSSEPGSTFECSIDTGTPAFGPCSGPGAAHTPSGPLSQGPKTFRVRATDPADNTDPSPATRGFTVDTQAPGAPNLTGTSPASPANDNNPEVLGSAEAGSTVRIYSTAGCSGSPLASGTAAQLASPGITVSVADNSTTALRATATDAAGNTSPCSAPISYTEDAPPSIFYLSPTDAAVGVARTAPIVAVFDQAMNKSSAEGSFSLRKTSNGTSVNGSFGWYGNALIFLPSEPLADATSYTATVSTAAQDTGGTPLPAPRSWQFTTATQPLITTIYPADGATEVLPNGYVVAVFDKAMDKPSAQAAFSLKLTSNGAAVPGAFSWFVNTLLFKPNVDLTGGAQYTATVSTAAKDLAGNPLPAAKSWRFTIRP